ncbi:hypothetical protein [Streptomyces aureocirculatus]|uniref:hypothetical protein n=1 Tax=Streptomyces aureocirculatus TaxID=67275 RepID=UPI0004C5CE4E|nr:hypothetical protein [Streptomyces aureocirculatus]
MTLDKNTIVTPVAHKTKDELRPFGRVVSYAEAVPFGEQLNMVLRDGMHKPLPYYDDELAIVD